MRTPETPARSKRSSCATRGGWSASRRRWSAIRARPRMWRRRRSSAPGGGRPGSAGKARSRRGSAARPRSLLSCRRRSARRRTRDEPASAVAKRITPPRATWAAAGGASIATNVARTHSPARSGPSEPGGRLGEASPTAPARRTPRRRSGRLVAGLIARTSAVAIGWLAAPCRFGGGCGRTDSSGPWVGYLRPTSPHLPTRVPGDAVCYPEQTERCGPTQPIPMARQ